MQTVEQEKPRLMVSITKEMVTISFGLCLENSSNFIMLIIILWLKGYKGSAHKMLVVLSKEMMVFVENVQHSISRNCNSNKNGYITNQISVFNLGEFKFIIIWAFEYVLREIIFQNIVGKNYFLIFHITS